MNISVQYQTTFAATHSNALMLHAIGLWTNGNGCQ